MIRSPGWLLALAVLVLLPAVLLFFFGEPTSPRDPTVSVRDASGPVSATLPADWLANGEGGTKTPPEPVRGKTGRENPTPNAAMNSVAKTAPAAAKQPGAHPRVAGATENRALPVVAGGNTEKPVRVTAAGNEEPARDKALAASGTAAPATDRPRLRVLLRGLEKPEPLAVTLHLGNARGSGDFARAMTPLPLMGGYVYLFKGEEVQARIFHLSVRGFRDTPSAEIRLQDGESYHEFDLDRGLVLEGEVRDESYNPVGNASLTLQEERRDPRWGNAARWMQPRDTCFSGNEGRFIFTGLSEGKFIIEARHPDFAPASVEARLPGGGPVQVLLRRGALASGTVFGTDGQPVAAARVSLLAQRQNRLSAVQDGNGALETLSGNSGEFVFRHLSDGRYLLAADAGERGQSSETNFTVHEGRDVAGLEIRLNPALSISGKVLDETGVPLGNIMVYFFSQFGSGPHKSNFVRSDEAGSFRIGELMGGLYSLSAANADGRDRSSQVTVRAGSANVVLRFQKGLEFKVRVLAPDGKNMTSCAINLINGKGTLVSQLGTNLVPGDTATGLAPYFAVKIPPLTKGSHGEEPEVVLTATAEGFAPGKTSPFRPTSYQGEILEITLRSGAELEVRARHAASGLPLGEADIQLLPRFEVGSKNTLNLGMYQPQNLRTGPSGSVVFTGLEAGDYQVVVAARALARKSVGVNVAATGHPPVEIALDRGASLSGVLRGSDLQPLAGWRVSLGEKRVAGEAWRGSAQLTSEASGGDGGYRLDNIPAGEYHLRYNPENQYTGSTREISFTEGENKILDLGAEELSGLGSIEGRYLAEGGDLIAGQIWISSLSPNRPSYSASASLDAEGRFNLQGVPEGPHKLTFADRQGQTFSRDITMPPGGQKLQIELRRSKGTITGTAILPDGTPAESGQVSVLAAGGLDNEGSGNPMARALSTSRVIGGAIEVTGLEPGSYDVIVQGPMGQLPAVARGVRVEEGARADIGRLQLETGREVALFIADGRGSPVRGAWVRVFDADGRFLPVPFLRVSDAEGKLDLPSAPVQPFKVQVAAPGFLPAFAAVGGPETRVVLARESRVRVTLQGSSAGARQVLLEPAAPASPAGAAPSPGTLSAQSDAAGIASFNAVPPGNYRVRVLASVGGDEARSSEFAVKEGESQTFHMTVP